tara:strand:+ start:100 stop:315 length:216 start_codon:yes stop_codon:yes gene_type:complete
VPNDLPQSYRRLNDVGLERLQIYFNLVKRLVPKDRIFVQKFYHDLAHVIREDEILEEVWDDVDVATCLCLL